MEFSEPIDFLPRPSTVAEAPADLSFESGSCSMAPNVQEGEEGEYTQTFQFSCSGVIAPSTLSLTFSRALETADGDALGVFLTEVPVEFIKLEPSDAAIAADCLYWHL